MALGPLVCLALLAAAPSSDDAFQPAARILSRHCVRCHNADKTRGGLDLSTLQSALQGGATEDALVPGEPERSFLLIRAREGSMPPEKDGRPLTADEVRVLRTWIEQGANWPAGVTLPLASESGGAGVVRGKPIQAGVRSKVLRRLRWRRP